MRPTYLTPSAQQDELQQIIELINRLLQAKGIVAQAEREENSLYILLEAKKIPDRQTMIALVRLAISNLTDSSLETVWVYGRQTGDVFTSWSERIDRLSELNGQFHKAITQQQPNRTSGITSDKLQPTKVDRFLVCGMGNLGQHCVVALKAFASTENEIYITAIDQRPHDIWEVDQLPESLTSPLILGDCRRDSILQQAEISNCQAILIVTSDESVNIETAIAARRLNRDIRLVVRSGKQSLNELLKQKLGNFIAFDPTELPAASFTLAALGEDTLSIFNVADHPLRVVKQQVEPRDYRFDNFPLYEAHKKNYRLLSHAATADPATWMQNGRMRTALFDQSLSEPEQSSTGSGAKTFHQWSPDARVKAGDTIIYIERVEREQFIRPSPSRRSRNIDWQRATALLQEFVEGGWWRQTKQLRAWIRQDQTRQIAATGTLTAFLLGVLGSVLLKLNVPNLSWQTAISSAIILLLGGYGDVFGGLAETGDIPWWVQFICLCITAASLLFILGVLGLIADRLLSSKFDFLKRRVAIPEADHIVLVGLGRVGQRITTLLGQLNQPFVCLTNLPEQKDLMPNLPIVVNQISRGLSEVNLAYARSVLVATEDQMLNLEVALLARDAASQVNRTINLVVRTSDQRFSKHVAGLLPDAKALCAYALSAEAFVGAAFGENILGLFRLENQTVLVTEYMIEADDTLNGKLLSQVAYGYGVVPIYYQSGQEAEGKLMPSDDTQLRIGDRLVVLATIDSLNRIEWGEPMPPRRWQLQALKPLTPGATFSAGDILENISGCSLAEAREFMDSLPTVLRVPGVLELPLYDHQAYRLVQKLRKLLPVRLMALTDPADPESASLRIDWQTERMLEVEC